MHRPKTFRVSKDLLTRMKPRAQESWPSHVTAFRDMAEADAEANPLDIKLFIVRLRDPMLIFRVEGSQGRFKLHVTPFDIEAIEFDRIPSMVYTEMRDYFFNEVGFDPNVHFATFDLEQDKQPLPKFLYMITAVNMGYPLTGAIRTVAPRVIAFHNAPTRNPLVLDPTKDALPYMRELGAWGATQEAAA